MAKTQPPLSHMALLCHQLIGAGFVSIYTRNFLTHYSYVLTSGDCILWATEYLSTHFRNPRQCLICSQISLYLLGHMGWVMFCPFVMCHLLEPATLPGALNLRLPELSDAKWRTMPFIPY